MTLPCRCAASDGGRGVVTESLQWHWWLSRVPLLLPEMTVRPSWWVAGVPLGASTPVSFKDMPGVHHGCFVRQ